MDFSRRGFLKLSGVTIGGALLAGAPAGTALAKQGQPFKLHKPIGETPTICCFCGVGCGAIVAAQDGKVLNVEGDPDHPINQGSLCSKGSALYQVANNKRRITKVKYRAPGNNYWEEKSWDWAINEITRRIKNTRDTTFVERDSSGRIVNRTEAIANLGGSALDNEECYLLSKLTRALGVVYLEHHARI